ncbi:hypothetical protein LSTR_LSTR008830 [Laodelphax striatellus]|uniref:BTB domain-containing protein n=1 Tax=Laodelphax striatellus TaxID=195883 RepID=A0A482WRV5_LAOST|nr:hypothetical protein LSTR_LSTR008830 [Laodelphax striatellus]
MGSEHYCLRWNNHQSNLLGVFSQLLQDESLVDVTLACSEGLSIRAHKVVLSACSSYFRSLFVDHPNRHPIVILKDVCFAELRTLVEFMYRGEVNIEYCQLSALLKTAESLKVKGLAEMTHLRSADADDSTDARSRDERSGGGGGGGGGDTVSSAAAAPDDTRPRLTPSPPPPPSSTAASATVPLSLKRPPPSDSESPPPPPTQRQPPPSPPPNTDMDNNTMDENMTPDQSRSPEPARAVDDDDSRSSMQSSGPSDMTYRSSHPHPPPHSPPHSPLAGPSGMPPVQQVPLSLKKEVDWDRNDDKSTTGESSSDYRHPHDPERERERERESVLEGGGGCMYSCMYCGAVFPHQSKLTRHILSHSLETLKYREQVQAQLQSQVHALGAGHLGAPPPPHLPPQAPPPPPDHVMMVDTGGGDPAAAALCKFCGKSFPDVGSLIGHLPAHTGDRPFKCEFCGKAFKLRHHMKDHCRVHTGERPFRCTLCGKTFSRSTILKAHEKTHYPKYVRKFLSSPSPEDERGRGGGPPDPLSLPCDLSTTDGERSTPLYLPRPPSP